MTPECHRATRSLSAAIRQRRCRQRRRQGAVFIEMELGSGAVRVLARIGFLAESDVRRPQPSAISSSVRRCRKKILVWMRAKTLRFFR
jgi:hypothetical protein